MAKQVQRDQTYNISTISHVDHSRTTLTAAITKTLYITDGLMSVTFDQIDKELEEKAERSRFPQHVEYRTSNRHYARRHTWTH